MRIGIFYQNNEQWIGGTYYIQNLILGVKTQPTEQQPEILVFGDKEADFEQLASITQYPKLRFWKLGTPLEAPLWQRGINRLARVVLGRNWFEKRPLLDAVFPMSLEHKYLVETARKQVYWIPDFQEAYLPELTPSDARARVQQSKQYIADNARYLVLSSRAARADFERFYPDALRRANLSVSVLPFAVSLPDAYKSLDISELQKKYGLPKDYFFAPNQFWKHKNQTNLIEAVRLLKAQGKLVTVAFSGKEYDHRHPDYAEQLKKRVQTEGLTEQVRFLGFIDRAEQLALMSAARAIVQPSLFEGWSTVVEDAKALNKPLILSDLLVHREQLSGVYAAENARFFNPHAPAELADCLANPPESAPTQVDYPARIRAFGRGFLELIKS